MDLLRQYSNCLAGARMFYQDALAASSPTASALLAQRAVTLYDQALSISDVIYDTLHPEISATEKERFIAAAYMQKNLNKASTAARQETQQLDSEIISGIRSCTAEEMKAHKERAKTLYMGIAGVITQKMFFDVTLRHKDSVEEAKAWVKELESLLATIADSDSEFYDACSGKLKEILSTARFFRIL